MDAAELPALLTYSPETGKLYWLPRPLEMFASNKYPKQGCGTWNARYAGKEAFTAINTGYHYGRIHDRGFLAHRVAWALVHGEWPSEEIDHINGKRTDNRLANLRPVSHADNCRNFPRMRSNTSGTTGVSWSKAMQRWHAYIGDGPDRINIGYYKTLDEAVTERKRVERECEYHENHDRIAA